VALTVRLVKKQREIEQEIGEEKRRNKERHISIGMLMCCLIALLDKISFSDFVKQTTK
jgi:hypothetical protein